MLLNVGAIVTTSEEAAALRAAVGSFEGRRLHLVQFAGPIQPEWYEELEATGAEVIQYIPSFAYLVYGDESALSRVQEMARTSAAVRWDGAYLDGYKIQPEARPETRARLGLPADQDAFAIQLVADPAANGETVRLVERRGVGGVRQRWEILKYVNLVVTLPLDAVDEVAARPDVVSIDRHVTPQKFDERQDRILSGQLTGNGPTPGDYLAYLAGKGFTQSQFTASGFVVDVTDSGIDNATTTPNHFGLRVGGDARQPGPRPVQPPGGHRQRGQHPPGLRRPRQPQRAHRGGLRPRPGDAAEPRDARGRLRLPLRPRRLPVREGGLVGHLRPGQLHEPQPAEPAGAGLPRQRPHLDQQLGRERRWCLHRRSPDLRRAGPRRPARQPRCSPPPATRRWSWSSPPATPAPPPTPSGRRAWRRT